MSIGRMLAAAVVHLLLFCHAPACLAQAASLRAAAEARGFSIGAAVAMTPLRNETAYVETLRREFNMVVAENVFKMDALQPSRGTFNFAEADALVEFAQANRMKLRGHTLVWHQQLPNWLTSGSYTREQVVEIMRNHITTVMTRYRGKVAAWDVVNEAIDDGSGALRNSFWFQHLGADYIRMAFEFARQADPSARLYYNDYSIEGITTKSNAVYNLVSGLRNQGVPIDGVGWQMHQVNPFRIQAQHQTNAQRLAALGLELSMTEMDIRISLPSSADELLQQALGYRESAAFCLSLPSCKALVLWGFTDKHSWIPGTFPGTGDGLIFDASYQPKPAYTALLEALSEGQPPTPTPPATPGGLTASAGDGRVTLNWSAASGATSYTVKRATAGAGPYTAVATGLASPSFVQTGLANGTTYFYVVSAVNASGASPDSAPVSATPQAAPPPGGAVTASGRVASGSNPWWSELDVTFSHAAPLSALTITITVQKTPGVTASGQYHNLPGSAMTASRTETATSIVYTYTLAAGQTLPAGNNRLVAAQFGGNGTAHPYSDDSWSVSNTTTQGATTTLSGGF